MKKITPKSKTFGVYFFFFFFCQHGKISSSNQKEFEFAMNLKQESSTMLRNILGLNLALSWGILSSYRVVKER